MGWQYKEKRMAVNRMKELTGRQGNADGITYQNMFWLFMLGNVAGVLLEGVWCFARFHRWESHVVTVWGPFCLIYGVGVVVLYIAAAKLKRYPVLVRFLAVALILDAVEYFCGWLIDVGLGMKAWDYSGEFLNLHGRICLFMTVVWGVAGLLFARFCMPACQTLFGKMRGQGWKIACAVLSVFMIVNLSVTAVAMVRWSARHKNIAPSSSVGQLIDRQFDDKFMQTRFMEWSFIDSF